MEELSREIETILDRYVRPSLKQHGGDIHLLEIQDRTAYVRFMGHCSGCPSAKYTLESLVGEEIRKHTDRISQVKLEETVSQELYDFAKELLQRKKS